MKLSAAEATHLGIRQCNLFCCTPSALKNLFAWHLPFDSSRVSCSMFNSLDGYFGAKVCIELLKSEAICPICIYAA